MVLNRATHHILLKPVVFLSISAMQTGFVEFEKSICKSTGKKYHGFIKKDGPIKSFK